MSGQIRVVLIEDNKVFREALELLLGLQPDIDVVGWSDNGSDAAAVVAANDPEVVLVDYRLPGMDGVQVTRAIKEAAPHVGVICLTASVTRREIAALLEAGATACLMKDEELDHIVATVKRAAARTD